MRLFCQVVKKNTKCKVTCTLWISIIRWLLLSLNWWNIIDFEFLFLLEGKRMNLVSLTFSCGTLNVKIM
jgi:hypothetical protein